MANTRDRKRDIFIYQERKHKGRTLKSIADELGMGLERVRQVYRRIDWEINRCMSDNHKDDTEEQREHNKKVFGENAYNLTSNQEEREEKYKKKWGLE